MLHAKQNGPGGDADKSGVSVVVSGQEEAPENIEPTLADAWSKSPHGHRSWLKAIASRNMKTALVTEVMFQSPIGWLKATAPLNINRVKATEDMFQFPMGWSKATAS